MNEIATVMVALVSCIIPVYNSEKYIKDCIESVIHQSMKEIEIIIVNDGSTDSSAKIVRQYCEQDARIIYIYQDNQGTAVARNTGVENAHSDWICFIDSDDVISRYYIETLYKMAVDSNCRIVTCECVEGNQQPEFHQLISTNYIVNQVNENYFCRLINSSSKCYWIVCAKIISRDIIKNIPFSAGRIYEDNAVVYKWLFEAGKICSTSLPMYFYRVNNSSITHQTFSKKQMDCLWALKQQIDFFSEIHYEKMRQLITRRYILATARLFFEASRMGAESQIIRQLQKILRRANGDTPGLAACSSENSRAFPTTAIAGFLYPLLSL